MSNEKLLNEIREKCEQKMLRLGADSFWYWGVGAFVFSGEQTTISISGKNYITPDLVIRENDIITIDLSPQYENVWGDYARTIIIENGVLTGRWVTNSGNSHGETSLEHLKIPPAKRLIYSKG